jgi:S-DNA-T family DNA segregation ATPase FtsK/SpoIIIE
MRYDSGDVQYDNQNKPTVIDEAVFTFQPPANLELPKQNIYVPPEQVNPNLQKSSNENLEKDSQEDVTVEDYINENQPIKLDFAKIDKEKEEQEKLLIEVDKSEEDIRKMKIQRETNIRSGLRNPLGVGIHDENLKKYQNPKLELLDVGEKENFANDEELQQKGRTLQEKLQTFGINIFDLEVTRGPVVTQYEFVPADGVKISKIEGLSDDLSMALKAKSVHIIAPVPGKGTVGIQIPNSNPSTVRFRSVISTPAFAHSKFELPLALGKTVSGEPFVADLAKMPHLLIAGSTGSGKSVGINTIISSLLYKKHPSQLKFVVIDPKKVELTQYARLSNHFLAVSPDLQTEIVTEPQDAITILKAAVLEMEKRYTLLEIAKQRNIKDYNEKIREGAFKNDIMIDHRELPYIVVIVDELADLMLTAGKEVELPIVRLAQMARAVGIHLIIATQRPSVNVITGIIKANFPARIAYLTAQKVDSRTILDASGAEALLGNGDMLYSSANQPKPIRMQNPFISTDEVEKICDFIGNQDGYSEPYMLPSTFESGNEGEYDVSAFDPLFKEAAELIIDQQQASTSMLQRRLKIGFARAGRIMDELTASGVVGPPQGSKPRAVLMESISALDRVLGG